MIQETVPGLIIPVLLNKNFMMMSAVWLTGGCWGWQKLLYIN